MLLLSPYCTFHPDYKTIDIISFVNSVLSNIIHPSLENANVAFCQAVLRIYRLTEELQILSAVFLLFFLYIARTLSSGNYSIANTRLKKAPPKGRRLKHSCSLIHFKLSKLMVHVHMFPMMTPTPPFAKASYIWYSISAR